MPERMRPVEPSREYPTSKEKKETEGRFVRQILRSAARLIAHRPLEVQKRLKDLPRRYDFGATLVPTILFTLATGCKTRIVDCSPEESEYLHATIDWILDNPEAIQEQMDQVWPKQNITAEELVSTLAEATVKCGITKDESVRGEKRYKGPIIIAVNNEIFQDGLVNFQEGQWTASYSLDQVTQIANLDNTPDLKQSLKSYWYSMAIGAEVLAHESAHEALGKMHKRSVKKEIKTLQEKYENQRLSLEEGLDEMLELDEIYAWGAAAAFGALATEQDYLDAYARVSYATDDAN